MEVVFFLFLYHLPTPCSRSIILQSRVTNILVSEEPAGQRRGNCEKCGQCCKNGKKLKKTGSHQEPVFSFPIVLSTETKLLDDASVSFDINSLEIVQKLTSFTYETEK